MTLEDFVEYCLSKKGVTEDFPFDENTLVFKVAGKMFALTDANEFASINLKCDPEKAIDLREKFTAVQPGYHMNKKHWNTVTIHDDATDKLIYQWIDHSYDLVVASLPKKIKQGLQED
ncbi:MAG: MmcQ/YjbR family DNA-binding protein [Crocinitomicaceae bacterium]|nr:MmcQ/YjbR family DNA-binding protein [Crocinitomicaceae bacterium]MBK8927766.1 MmcQ/YjbR family DNA-binding protein [Crocinitomicaceae bacterium]